ncbi:MAG: sodium:proton antiporter [Bacteroides sp.]|nr:sodium:proton antiporter [Bacteroides sp.]MBD5357268.1 sodium:proton antiporter [Bacteroides sp.]
MTKTPTLWAALTPVVALLTAVVIALITKGSEFVADYGYAMLLGAAAVALIAGIVSSKLDNKRLMDGLRTSARQTLPAVPILLLIGTVSATWMLSGVVPMLIEAGLTYIHPPLFLLTTCCVCAFISLLTGSSWTTIATIGMAFMGIGTMLGVAPGWIAGAIISGAYFGDKMSPLSDTTVLAAASSEVNLFSHIRYMLITTIPSLVIALTVFIIAGSMMTLRENVEQSTMIHALEQTFNLSPWIFVIPVLTAILIIMRINTLLTLLISTLLGLGGIFIFQPQIVAQFGNGEFLSSCKTALHILLTDTAIPTGDESLNELVATGGMKGMLSTIWLILSAMLFGGVMMGTGLLARITQAFTSLLRNRVSAVGATAASGLFLNSATADQYLSIIVGANMYRNLYSRLGLEGRLLSRTLEDSVSVTSVLIPWNSCGVTQSAVLGVSTLTYLPYCVFNYLSPIMSLLVAITGFKIVELTHQQPERISPEPDAVILR